MVINSHNAAYPGFFDAMRNSIIIVHVLTEDAVKQKAVYAAAFTEDQIIQHGQDEINSTVHNRGMKLSYREAVIAFPDLKENEYRR